MNAASWRPTTDGATSPPTSVEFRFTQTESFAALLQQLGASLLVSTYQANKLLAVRANGHWKHPAWQLSTFT